MDHVEDYLNCRVSFSSLSVVLVEDTSQTNFEGEGGLGTKAGGARRRSMYLHCIFERYRLRSLPDR